MRLQCRHPAQEPGQQGQAPTGEGRRRRGGRARIRSRAARRVQDAGGVVGDRPVAGSQAERLLDSDSRLPYILTWTKAPVLHQNAGRPANDTTALTQFKGPSAPLTPPAWPGPAAGAAASGVSAPAALGVHHQTDDEVS